MSKLPELLAMLKAGVHFGHRESKWHPKMRPFIYTSRNGVHILDLEKTSEYLKRALDVVKETTAEGGVVLFVGTKRQASGIVQKVAQDAGMPYVTERWLGGTLTNFKVINSLVKKLKRLEDQEQSPDYEQKYKKRERLTFTEEKERLLTMVGGLRTLEKLPAAIFFVDIKEEKTAVKEAQRMKIPTIGIVDTNVNPENVTHPIPANDDATKAINLIVSAVGEAVKEGVAESATRAPKEPAKEEKKEKKEKKESKDKKAAKKEDKDEKKPKEKKAPKKKDDKAKEADAKDDKKEKEEKKD